MSSIRQKPDLFGLITPDPFGLNEPDPFGFYETQPPAWTTKTTTIHMTTNDLGERRRRINRGGKRCHYTYSCWNPNNHDWAPEQTILHTSPKKANHKGKSSRKANQKTQIPAIGYVATSSAFSTKTKTNPPQSTGTTTNDDGSKGRPRKETSKRRRSYETQTENKMVMPPWRPDTPSLAWIYIAEEKNLDWQGRKEVGD